MSHVTKEKPMSKSKPVKPGNRSIVLRHLKKAANKASVREQREHADAVDRLRMFCDVFGAYHCFHHGTFVGDEDIATPYLRLPGSTRQIYEVTPSGFIIANNPEAEGERNRTEYASFTDLSSLQLFKVLAALCEVVDSVGVMGGSYDENEHDSSDDDEDA